MSNAVSAVKRLEHCSSSRRKVDYEALNLVPLTAKPLTGFIACLRNAQKCLNFKQKIKSLESA